MSSKPVHPRWANHGCTLSVPNVQDLVESGCLTHVPGRYIRPEDHEAHEVLPANHEDIPVVDMARLLDPDSAKEEAAKLNAACEDWGFFLLINHGVPEDVMTGMKDNLQGFFRQPLEERLKSAQPEGSIEGYGQAFVKSEDQKLDWADMMYLYGLPLSIRNYDLWPKQPPTFREAFEAYSREVKRVATCLFEQIAKNLGLENPETFTGMMEDGVQGIRMNYYPPCSLAHDKVIGISPHSDPVGITLLLQVNDVPGYQIKRHDKWLPIHPPPDAFMVNIGDIIEILTNGKYKSIEHRAVVNSNKERLSVAAFHNPDFDSEVGPLPEFCKNCRPNYKRFSFPDYTRRFFTYKLEGKKILDDMKHEG